MVACDIEGCITPGKGVSLDLTEIARLREFLRLRGDVSFVLCTGRPVPYVEAMGQVLDLVDSSAASICEGGGVLYLPSSDTCVYLAEEIDKKLIRERLGSGNWREEPGKSTCVSLYPGDGWSVADVYRRCVDAELHTAFNVVMSSVAVDITHSGVDKLHGLRAAASAADLTLSEVLAIGDSWNDLTVLEAAGLSACPANAEAALKGTVDYISQEGCTRGVIDILGWALVEGSPGMTDSRRTVDGRDTRHLG
jgi:hydroxymethylpyrimidine pyrophosphatase-like HAD family hydrolase